MGSVPSTPNPDGTDDPWWPIENQNFNLDHSPLLNVVEMDRQGQSAVSVDATDQNCEINEIEVKDGGEISKSDCENRCTDNGDEEECAEKDSASHECSAADRKRMEKREQSLEEFKEELRIKRERRQSAIANLRNEITSLREQLAAEKAINRQLRQGSGDDARSVVYDEGEDVTDFIAGASDAVNQNIESDAIQPNRNISLKSELANVQLQLQLATSEILSLQAELSVRQKQAETLKEVNVVSKQMIQIREEQLTQLRVKLKEIEDSLAERELSLMSDNLRQEYDRQLANIRNLRALYEERARVSAAERENLNRQLDTKRTELEAEVEKTSTLTERIETVEKELESTTDELTSTKQQLSQFRSENRELHEEMKVINQLFSQLLMGFNGGNDINIDKLSNMLEDNRELLNDITNREICKDGAAALPKLLFDLVTQAEENDQLKEEATKAEDDLTEPKDESPVKEENVPKKSNVTSAQEICHNLPKVWKVLIELLNHQKAEQVTFTENGESEDCYNSVQTPSGPKLVLSVSKTYIKLKDLILEKKFLQKETNKLKNLNNHLEQRLGHQEKRLGAVSVELNKTWSLVGKMQRQHRQLHTHEQVLRYQLQQKRRMLTELKDELEYCRRKWALAREKNDESQSQWNTLRLEFSNRKLQDANNSAESGYSDEPISDDENSDDESSKVKRNAAIKADLLIPTTKKIARVHSVSPTRNGEHSSTKKRDLSAPPVTTFLTEVFQTTSEIVPSDLNVHTSVASNGIEKIDLNYAAKSSVVQPKKAAKITVKNICSEAPSSSIPSSSSRGVKPKSVDEIRPRLSRELRKKAVKVKEKKKSGEETLEEMFFRLSGLEPPPPEPEEEEDEEEECDDESKDIVDITASQDCKTEVAQATAVLQEQSLDNDDEGDDDTPATNLDDIILSEEDEERRIRRAERFQRLEEQCQQLMTQVINNSSRGDELNLQLDNVQRRYTPVRENSSRSVERTDNATSSSLAVDETNSLTQKEQEYTSRRAARLKRLEEECKEFLSRQTKSRNRAHEMSNKLDRLHQRYGSQENRSEADGETGYSETNDNEAGDDGGASGSPASKDVTNCTEQVVLTEEEQAYISRRNERLKRLEEQSAELLNRMAQSANRASNIENTLDALHEKFSEKETNAGDAAANVQSNDVTASSDILELNVEDVVTDETLPEIANSAQSIRSADENGFIQETLPETPSNVQSTRSGDETSNEDEDTEISSISSQNVNEDSA